MRNVLLYLVGAVFLATVVLAATPAGATNPTPEPPATKTIEWIIPAPGTSSNVTWPQPLATPENLAPLCGTEVTLQADADPYRTAEETARTDALSADGVLSYGEDHGWVLSWSFRTVQSECPPPVPVCEEDMPCWDCTTMGNLICGPVAPPEEPQAPATLADTGYDPRGLVLLVSLLLMGSGFLFVIRR